MEKQINNNAKLENAKHVIGSLMKDPGHGDYYTVRDTFNGLAPDQKESIIAWLKEMEPEVLEKGRVIFSDEIKSELDTKIIEVSNEPNIKIKILQYEKIKKRALELMKTGKFVYNFSINLLTKDGFFDGKVIVNSNMGTKVVMNQICPFNVQLKNFKLINDVFEFIVK